MTMLYQQLANYQWLNPVPINTSLSVISFIQSIVLGWAGEFMQPEIYTLTKQIS